METYNYYTEDEADRLLSKASEGRRAYYGNCSLARKLRMDRQRGHLLDLKLESLNEATTLLRRHALRAVVANAELTRRQRQVLRAKLAGDGWLEIGMRLSISRQAAQRMFLQAVNKIRHAWRTYPLAGLDEVYRDEVRRYAPRRH